MESNRRTGALQRFAWIGYLLAVAGLLAAGGLWLVFRQFDLPLQVSLAAALIGLAAAVIMDPERVQVWLTGRQARYGGNVLVMTLALLGILVVLNLLLKDHSQRWDLTEDKDFTLTGETRAILRELPAPVTVTGFFTPQSLGQQDRARELLDQYRHEAGGKLSYAFVDPQREPVLAQASKITRDGELLLQSGGHSEHVTSLAEQDISAALLKLSNPVERKAYFLVGEGERATDDSTERGYSEVKAGLERLNIAVDTLSLLISSTVPADATVLIVPAPTQSLAANGISALDAFLKSGGSLVYLSDPLAGDSGAVAAGPDSLGDYLSQNWGISVRTDLVIDMQTPLNPAWPVVVPGQSHGSFGTGPAADRLRDLAVYFPTARSLVLQPAQADAVNPVTLVESAPAPAVWGETDFAGLATGQPPIAEGIGGQPAFDPAHDFAGPLILAATAENAAGGGRVVVFGDVDFASNGFVAQVGNGNLFYDAVNWATGQGDLLTLPPKDRTNRFIRPPSAITANLVLLLAVFVMPLSVLVGGGVVWYQRRRHS